MTGLFLLFFSGCSIKSAETYFPSDDPDGCRTLEGRIFLSHEELAIEAIEQGSDPNCVNEDGMPSVLRSNFFNNPACLGVAISHGLRKDLTWNGAAILSYAQNPATVELLCANGWDPNFYGEARMNAPVCLFISTGRFDELEVLFKFGGIMIPEAESTLKNATLSADREEFYRRFPHIAKQPPSN